MLKVISTMEENKVARRHNGAREDEVFKREE